MSNVLSRASSAVPLRAMLEETAAGDLLGPAKSAPILFGKEGDA